MQREEIKELSKIFYETIKKNSVSEKEILTTITNPNFDEEYANLIKIHLLKNVSVNSKIESGFSDTDLGIVIYCYYTTDGKEALKAKRRIRQKLIMEATSGKWTKRNFILEPDAGAAYGHWYDYWVKDAEKRFQTYFGKDPCRWLPKIREKFEKDREQANRTGDF